MTHLKTPITRIVTCANPRRGVKPQLVATLHPNGLLELREKRHRQGKVVVRLQDIFVHEHLVKATRGQLPLVIPD